MVFNDNRELNKKLYLSLFLCQRCEVYINNSHTAITLVSMLPRLSTSLQLAENIFENTNKYYHVPLLPPPSPQPLVFLVHRLGLVCVVKDLLISCLSFPIPPSTHYIQLLKVLSVCLYFCSFPSVVTTISDVI